MQKTPAHLTALRHYVRATNYLAAAQIYLQDNILLTRPLVADDIKPRLLGHWGTCPGINFVYAHINHLIQQTNSDFIYIVGPGHGFPAIQANLFLEGALTHRSPDTIPYSLDGLTHICQKFSAPYGFPSHSNPSAPGAILEGGELGYSLSVAYGAALDHPDLIAVCLVGDGESETGPLAASWQANKLLPPKTSGAVLPIVHLNGYKISGPTMFGRMSDAELTHYFTGLGYLPLIVDESTSPDVYATMADTMQHAYDTIRAIQQESRSGEDIEKPQWPVIILRTPKGWTGVQYEGDTKLEGNCLSHQVILGNCKKDPTELALLEAWLRSYHFPELLQQGSTLTFTPQLTSLIPPIGKTCGTQPITTGGDVVQNLILPDLTNLLPTFVAPGATHSSPMQLTGQWLRDAMQLNKNNLRLFSPDETYSNQLHDVFTVTHRAWQWPIEPWDRDIAREGQVLEILSEHTLFGMMQGYTTTGRHGVFASYEAFVQVIASQADQYAKFIKASQHVPWRTPLPAMNIILTSLLERQDHNGFSHQNPSFISSMLEKDGDIIKVYLPPDATSMLITCEQIFTSRNHLNAVVVGKKELPVWLNIEQAKQQMQDGIMTWDFASDTNPHLVMVSSGDYVTCESLAAIQIIKELVPSARIRYVNVSELTALGVGDHTTDSSSSWLDTFFTADQPVLFNFHGYPATIKKLLYNYTGSHRIQISGYREEGSTTTPFDMEVRNGTSRYHLTRSAIAALAAQRVITQDEAAAHTADINTRIQHHHEYILEHGVDPVELENWQWK